MRAEIPKLTLNFQKKRKKEPLSKDRSAEKSELQTEIWTVAFMTIKNKYIIYNSKPFLMSLLERRCWYSFMCIHRLYEMNTRFFFSREIPQMPNEWVRASGEERKKYLKQ